MNWAGDSHDAYSVIIDSALGLLGARAEGQGGVPGQVKWLQDYLGNKAPPKFPLPDRRGEGRGRQGGVRRQLRGLPRERQDRAPHAAR